MAPPASLRRVLEEARKVWACRWPEEEEAANLRDLRVRIAVHVDQNGSAEDVEILDPARASFARAAQRFDARSAKPIARQSMTAGVASAE